MRYNRFVNHHAYFHTGDIGEGVDAALAFGKKELGLDPGGNPDVITLRYQLFSVDDARALGETVSRTAVGGKGKLVIVATHRIFHEAQNALLKTFEEPPEGTTLVLIVPSEGNIIPTLRSRLLRLPETEDRKQETEGSLAEEFAKAGSVGRQKVVERILERAKKDDADEKQAARGEALQLAEGVLRIAYEGGKDRAFLSDLSRLVPVLHERSAPLKPILEHLLIVAPKSLDKRA